MWVRSGISSSHPSKPTEKKAQVMFLERWTVLREPLILTLRFFRPPGIEIPPHATLVFDVLLVDLHNPKDNITIEELVVPETCTRRTVVGDYIRYHYNGTFLNGVTFDTR